jgi:tetratricopeptide (TPR) repeat protein
VRLAETEDALDEAFHLLAWGRLFSGDPAEAKKALASITRAHATTHALEGAIALELGDADKALEQFEKILPRLNPWLEDYFVRAILVSRRWDDARTLFEDELGREFSPSSLLAVMTAARADGAVDAAEAMKAVLARKLPPQSAVPG